MRLRVYTYLGSHDGLSPVSTLIVGSAAAVLIDPPVSLSDTRSVISFIASKTSNPLGAIFIACYRRSECSNVNFILEAFPAAKLYAATYVVDAINRKDTTRVTGRHEGLATATAGPGLAKLEPYDFSFFALAGDLSSPIVLLGPVQGSCAYHTLFWLPTERTFIAGDAVFARSTHVNVEHIASSADLSAWRLTLDLISSLDPVVVTCGHIDRVSQFDARKDIEHMYRYLDLMEDRIVRPMEEGHPKVLAEELYRVFAEAFPNCGNDQDSYLMKTVNQFAEDGHGAIAGRRNGTESKAGSSMEGYMFVPASVIE